MLVLLFSDFVECIKMTNNYTTIQQNYSYLLIFLFEEVLSSRQPFSSCL